MIRLYMDENVERAITAGLIARDVNVVTAQQDGRDEASDSEILDRATELSRIVFTRDADPEEMSNSVQFLPIS